MRYLSMRFNQTPIRRQQASHKSLRPCLESLQDRTLLTTFTVTNLLDSGEGSLRQAIVNANSESGPDVIRFENSLEGTIALTSGQLVITDDLTIDGPGSDDLAVSGEEASRVFAVIPEAVADALFTTPTLEIVESAPTVTIEGLTIENGLADDDLGLPVDSGFALGGGLYNLGGIVHLDDVAMIDNVASNAIAAGGALANEFGGTVTIEDSLFEGNLSEGLAIGAGGAIHSDLGTVADAPGATTIAPSLTIAESSFIENTARSLSGYFIGEETVFSGFAVGGAIINLAGSLDVNSSEFVANTIEGGPGSEGAFSGGTANGGAINSGNISPFGMAQSTLSVRRSTFLENSAISGPGVADGVAGGEASGGAITVINGGIAKLERNVFFGNLAIGESGEEDAPSGIGYGGAVAGVGGANLELRGNEFFGNQAGNTSVIESESAHPGRGGAIASFESVRGDFDTFPGAATISSSRDQFLLNTAYSLGGGIYNEGDLTVRGGRLYDNLADGLADVTVPFSLAVTAQGGAGGGGIANYGSLYVVSTKFVGNEAIGADDAVADGVFVELSSSFPGFALGGGLAHIEGFAEVRSSQFIANVAEAGDRGEGEFAAIAGGGAITNYATLILDRSLLAENLAIAGDDSTSPNHNGHALGGAINTGSLVPAFAPDDPGASLFVNNTRITNNWALGGNDNIVTDDPSTIPLADTPNHALGGGILVYQGTAEITGTKIRNNVAVGGAGGADVRGGFAVGGGAFFFNFLGGVEATVFGSQILRNTVIGAEGVDGLGGGIATGSLGAPFGAPGTLEIAGSLIAFNTAEGGNGADGLGGGIYNDVDTTLELFRTFVFGNMAIGGSGGVGIGGGIFNLGTIDLILSPIFVNMATTSDDDCFGC